MISSMIYKKQIDELQKGFSQKYTEEQLKRLFESIQGKEDTQLKRAVDWLILNKPRLPFPGEVIQAVDEEAQKDWQKKKNQEHYQAEDFFQGKAYKGLMAKESLLLIKRLLGMVKPELDKKQLYYEMLNMETKYPGIGWRECAEKLNVPKLRMVRG